MELAWNTQKNQMSDVKGKEMEPEHKLTDSEFNEQTRFIEKDNSVE